MKKILLLVLIYFLPILAAANNSIIAIVNDGVITKNEINEHIRPYFSKEQKIKVINQKINLLLQLQEIEAGNIMAGPEELERILNNIAIENQLTLAQLKSLPDFNHVLQQIALRKLRNTVLQNIYVEVTLEEIEQAGSDVVRAGVVDKQVKIAQIAINSIDADTMADTIDSIAIEGIVSEDAAIEQLLLNISVEIESGASFVDLAKLYSQEFFAQQGGESGWLSLEQLPLIFQHNIKKLKKDELSQPFKTPQGSWHIVKVIKERAIDINLLDVEYELIIQKENQYFDEWIDLMRSNSYIEIFMDRL